MVGSGTTRHEEVIVRRLPILFTILFPVAAGLALAHPAPAQEGGVAGAQREAMAKLQNWVGEWEGKGWAATGPGVRQEFAIHESVVSKLGGLVLLIQGRGTSTDPDTGEEYVTHDALAILSFDPGTEQYVFRHYTSRGDSGEDPFVITDEGYEWGFANEEHGVHVKFAIGIEGNTWHETGQFSPDGSTWYPSLDMTLQRLEGK
jgi:hypothetical protein